MEKVRKLEKEKQELIEKLGVRLEKNHKVAPLAARILSTLILSETCGTTFEELVHHLGASKSTISNHLDHLQTTGKVDYVTKPGDRKRYFVISPNLVIQNIDETAAAWKAEQQIQEQIYRYKKSMNESNLCHGKQPFDLEIQKDFIIYFEEATAALQKLRQQIINKRNQAQNE